MDISIKPLDSRLMEVIPDQPQFVLYTVKSGEKYKFDISYEICSNYGFYSGTRVTTPKGSATVIGVHDGILWFHIDGDKGASFWDNCKTYEDLLQLGVSYITDEEVETTPVGSYRIKRIEFKNKSVSIMQQNENGPCPLIAIANILALRGCIIIDGKDNRITVNNVVSKIASYLREEQKKQTKEEKTEKDEKVNKVIETMSQLQIGLDVNFNFVECDSFESTTKSLIFPLLNIRMVHGWLVDPSFPVASIIANYTYNDLTLQLVASDPESMNQNKNDNKEENKDNNANTNNSEQKEERKLTLEEATFIRDFLTATSHQLTDYGLTKLHENIKEDELVVFFRNNHFSTLTKHNGRLYNLVTDIGYERERLVVWDLLETVDGNSIFYDGDFKRSEDVKREEIMNTALLYGFSKEKIEEAIVAVQKPNEELVTDDVLTWLSKNAEPV